MLKILLIFVLILLASCSNDPIVGLWKKTGVEIDGKMEWEIRPAFICFDENGTYRSGSDQDNLTHPGLWNFDSEENILSLQDTGRPIITYEINLLNDSAMTLTHKQQVRTIHMKKLNAVCTE